MSLKAFEIFAQLSLDSSNFEKGLNDSKNMAEKIGGGLTKAGKKMSKLSLAVGGLGVASVKTAANFEQSMAQVGATMGYSVDELHDSTSEASQNMKMLSDFAQEMGAKTKFSASESADALNYMALAGYDAEKSMQMLPNVLNLAAAGDMDLARASDMVTDAQTAFGMDIPRTTQMVDEMAKAASTGNTSVEQLGDAFLTVGGLAQELNGGMVTLADGTQVSVDGVQELEIALTAMANSGIKGSEAGTHMRNMLLKLSSPTSDGTQRLAELGVAVFDDTGKMRSLKDIMGDLKDNMSNMIPVFEKEYKAMQEMSPEELTKAIEDGNIAVEHFGVSLLDNEGNLRDWNDILLDINDTFENGALTQEQKIQSISDLFNTRDLASAESLLGAVNQDWDSIGESILGAEGAAQKMADVQLDTLEGQITIMKSALEGAAISFGKLLIPHLTEAAKKLQGFLTWLGELPEGSKKVILMVGGIVTALGPLLVGIGKVATGIGGIMKLGGLLSKISGLTGIVTKLGGALGFLTKIPVAGWIGIIITAILAVMSCLDGGEEMVAELPDKIMEVIQNIIDGIIDAIPTILEMIPTVLDGIINMIIEFVPAMIQAGIQIFTALVQALPTIIDNIVAAIPQIIGSVLMTLTNAIPQIISAGITLISSLVQALPTIIQNVVAAIPHIILGLVEAIIKSIPKIAEAGLNLLKGLVLNLAQAIAFIVTKLPSVIVGMVKALGNGIKEFANVGLNLVKGLWNGISNAKDWVIGKIKGFGEDILNGIKSFFGIHSPSRKFAEVGKYLALGLGVGWEDNIDGVTDDIMDSLNMDLNNATVDGIPTVDATTGVQLAGVGGVGGGDIIIPVYIGTNKLDEILIKQEQIKNYRSGGR